MLSLHQLTDSTDMSICMDNEALFDINQRQLKIAHPNFTDLNRVRPPLSDTFSSAVPQKK
jgi:tubulin beta